MCMSQSDSSSAPPGGSASGGWPRGRWVAARAVGGRAGGGWVAASQGLVSVRSHRSESWTMAAITWCGNGKSCHNLLLRARPSCTARLRARSGCAGRLLWLRPSTVRLQLGHS